MADKKKRFRLQPSLPRIRKRQEKAHHEPPSQKQEESRPPYVQTSGPGKFEEPYDEGHEEEPTKSRMQDKKLLIGIVLVIGLVVFVLIYLWLYPSQPANPGDIVTAAQVSTELARLQAMSTFPDNKNINTQDYPKTFGTYRGLTLEEVYYCSDVCPDYGAVYLVYKGVNPEECASADGQALHDFSFGGYIGCQPRVE